MKIVEKTNGSISSTRKFVWCGTEKCEFRGANNGIQLQVFSQGQYQSNTAYFYTRDHLGSIREMTDGAGTVVARYDYDPYGRSTTVIGTNKPDFNFTGLYQHSKSGLDFAIYRAYDPELGRWLSRDPYGSPGLQITSAPWRPFNFTKSLWTMVLAETSSEGSNLLAYVGNDPINQVDPAGLQQATPQQPGCDKIPNCLETHAVRLCCDEHDRCYARHGCNEGSWSLFGKNPDACNECNRRVAACFLRAVGNTIFKPGRIGLR